MYQATAILIFSRTILAESRVKQLHQHNSVNLQLHKALYNNTIATAVATNLPYYVTNEKEQVGATFGEKITNAISHIFAKGYNNIITIGTDCVSITTNQILQAATELHYNNNCIGADNHGGAYIIALQKISFDASKFKNLSWCTINIYSDLKNYCLHTNSNLTQLTVRHDVNNANELKQLLHKCKASIITLLTTIYSSLIVINLFNSPIYTANLQWANNRRGPPYL